MFKHKLKASSLKKNLLRLLPAILIIFLFAAVSGGCSLLHPSSQRKAEKKQAQAEKQATKEYDKARKQHLKNQNKKTVKMMKKTRKRSENVNAYKKRRTFLKGDKCP